MSQTSTPPLSNTAAKQQRLLDAALAAFLRSGFRRHPWRKWLAPRRCHVSCCICISRQRRTCSWQSSATRFRPGWTRPARRWPAISLFKCSWSVPSRLERSLHRQEQLRSRELKMVCEELLGPALIDYEEQFLSLIASAIHERAESTIDASGITHARSPKHSTPPPGASKKKATPAKNSSPVPNSSPRHLQRERNKKLVRSDEWSPHDVQNAERK